MLDIKFIRDNEEFIRTSLAKRGIYEKIDEFIQYDMERRHIIGKVEALKRERNSVSLEIGRLKKEQKPADELVASMKACSNSIKEYDDKLKEVEARLKEILLNIPNIPNHRVPYGVDDKDNVVLREWGTKRDFAFTPKPHWEIGETLKILDFQTASKIAGARFVLYRGPGALLERALINFMLDLHTKNGKYLEVIPPFMANSAALTGTGQLPKFKEELFHIENTEFYMIPTAEVPVTNIHSGDILPQASLPVRYVSYTPCFRAEAGSYGKDTRGIIRQHQFNKVELVKFADPDSSYDELEALTADAESVLKELEIPYRVVELCTGELGFSSARTYDIEVWLPGLGQYKEISSCSNFEDFQARRANIKFRPSDGQKPEFVHTLNGSALAVGRTVVAILENYQNADGTVSVPAKLIPYMKDIDIIRKIN